MYYTSLIYHTNYINVDTINLKKLISYNNLL